MEEQTTTEAVSDAGAQGALSAEETQATAVEQTTETAEQTQSESKGAQEALPNDDEKLQQFAANHGLELDSPNAIKAAKMAMDNQANFQRNRQKASELEKTLSATSDNVAEQVAQQTGQDPELLKRLQRVEVKEAVRDFWNTPDESGKMPDRSYEAKMIELLSSKPHLAGDLESLYATAVVKAGKLESQGGRKALETLAHKQQAAVPTGNATNPGVTSKGKPFAEMSIAEMEAKLGFVRR